MTDPQAGTLQPYEILRRQRAAQQRIADEEAEVRERLANRPRRKVRMTASHCMVAYAHAGAGAEGCYPVGSTTRG
jgi:hypothetical protein